MKLRRGWFLVFCSVTLIAVGYACQDQSISPTDSRQNVAVVPQQVKGQPPLAVGNLLTNFRTHLNGRNVVSPVDTRAQGEAIFHLGNDGSQISYKLTAANIENLLMAHIHLGTPEENGPVVVWLYPKDGPPPHLIDGRFNGVLAEHTIPADDLGGPLEGMPLDSLITHIGNGNAYVQAHTEQNPAGEIRGQIR